MRVCAEPGCGALQDETRCPAHRSQREQQRGSREARGYDHSHRKQRAAIVSAMAGGKVYTCWRCGRVVFPHAFDLGHCDDDRRVWHGVEHPDCNRGARGACPHPSHSNISDVR